MAPIIKISCVDYKESTYNMYMARLKILTFPDPRLRKVASPVKEFNKSIIKSVHPIITPSIVGIAFLKPKLKAV